MINKKQEYKNHIWKNGWVSGDKRWLFHAHGTSLGLDGKVHIEDGNILDWDITDNELQMGEKTYTIVEMKSYRSLVLKDYEGNIETFISH